MSLQASCAGIFQPECMRCLCLRRHSKSEVHLPPVQAGLGLVVSTVDRAQVEAMFLLKETAEMPAQQVSIQ